MMDFLAQPTVMIAMGLLLILLVVALPAMVLIVVLRANRAPKHREDQPPDERMKSA